ncbi:MAGE-domain-containing protein [Dichomitus squalens LYAD-421 SS1]|uniref:MAGE-domain-containing protein n=1 Tax=Dichomitus squalens (strain LYAD-421) TaxID=732165 RepID=R7SJR6_DICSQ|nr:MAGE-domain-containing protein [Dichomitus squalens LYAD-421 SS1]EJF56396.1 MAGE-domain-containing protein [Dichomitus squalens LYAD-421 SS1]
MARQTRSQRGPQASQSQPPRATQAGRSRRAQVEEEPEEEQVAQDVYDEDEGELDKAQGEIEKKARDLVRLALFNEQRRMPLRRDEISKKVLGSASRTFSSVLAAANQILQKTFGMELVEMQAMPSDKDMSEKDADLLKTTGVKKKAAPTGTKSYILRSLLDPTLIEQACAPDAEIREIEQKEHVDENEEFAEDDNPVGQRSTGSIFAWHASDQLAATGILYVVLALILVEGRVVNDGDLRAMLKRLQLPASASVPLSSQATNSQSLTIDAYLAQLTRQGYLEKLRAGTAAAGKGGQKRARATQAPAGGDDHLQAFEWRWGPRALTEVGERGIAQFVAEFMAGQPGHGEDEDEEEDAVGAGRDEGTQRRVQVIYKGIERAAAGGQLLEAR